MGIKAGGRKLKTIAYFGNNRLNLKAIPSHLQQVSRTLISLLGIEVGTATVDQKYIGQGRQLVSVAKLQRGIAQTKV